MQNIETIQWICPLYKDFRFWLFLSLKLSRALSFPLKTHGYVFHPQHYIQHSGPIICHHHLQMTKILGSLLCNPIAHCINNLLAIIGVLWPFGDLWWFPAQCVACSLTVWPGWPIQLVPKNDHLCAGLLHCWGSNTYNCIAIISMSSCKKDINKFCPILWNDKFSIFMPPPLGAGGIMFSGCPAVRLSEGWNIAFPHLHESVGPPKKRWPFSGMSVRPSVRPSVRRGFRAFAGERMEGMAWNVACWCILTTIRTD